MPCHIKELQTSIFPNILNGTFCSCSANVFGVEFIYSLEKSYYHLIYSLEKMHQYLHYSL